MIPRLIWITWTSHSAIRKRAVKLNHSLLLDRATASTRTRTIPCRSAGKNSIPREAFIELNFGVNRWIISHTNDICLYILPPLRPQGRFFFFFFFGGGGGGGGGGAGGAFLRWWHHVGGSFNLFMAYTGGVWIKLIFSNMWLCAVCWAHFTGHHELWPTSVGQPFSFLNGSWGLTGGNHYQVKLTDHCRCIWYIYVYENLHRQWSVCPRYIRI